MYARIYTFLTLAAISFTELAAAGQSVGGPAGNGGAAPAPGPQSGAPASQDQGFGGFPFFMLILMLVFMYFVLIRPQSKEQKRRKAMMEELKVGDDVVTIGGIHGKISRCGENDLDIKVKDGTEMTINLGAVNQVIKDGEVVSAQG